jgi:hypothetical protein
MSRLQAARFFHLTLVIDRSPEVCHRTAQGLSGAMLFAGPVALPPFWSVELPLLGADTLGFVDVGSD